MKRYVATLIPAKTNTVALDSLYKKKEEEQQVILK